MKIYKRSKIYNRISHYNDDDFFGKKNENRLAFWYLEEDDIEEVLLPPRNDPSLVNISDLRIKK